LNPFRHPQDPRLHRKIPGPVNTVLRVLPPHKFLILSSQNPMRLEFYRFDGQTAAPAAILSSGHPEASPAQTPGPHESASWLWRDLNGDGRPTPDEYSPAPAALGACQTAQVDAAGGLWLGAPDGTLYHWPCSGLDEQALPQYEASSLTSQTVSPDLAGPLTADYLVENKSLFLAGRIPEPATTHPAPAGETAPGLEVRRYHLMPGNSDPPVLRWRTRLPGDTTPTHPTALCAAGDLVFVAPASASQLHVLDARTGTHLGHLPASAHDRPLPPANSYSLRAHRRQDGSYLVFIHGASSGPCQIHHLDDPLGASR